MKLKDIIELIQNAKHVLISAHTNPDGDAIGAMVAMGHFCNAVHIPYTILLEEEVERFKYLTDEVITATQIDSAIDTFVALDCGDTKRLVGYEDYFTKAKKTLVIDHHVTNEHYGMYNYVLSDASSTSEIIFDLLEEAKVMFNKEIGMALYTGMVTDTGGFMHSCTSSSTMKACAKLMELDFDFSTLYHQLIHEKTLQTIKLQGVAVNHLVEVQKGIYLAYITKEEIDKLKATKDDIDGIVSFLKSISGVEVIAFIYPLHKGNGYKLSTRSNKPYNVAAFCQQFEGGGHERAAGATLDGPIEETILKVQAALLQL